MAHLAMTIAMTNGPTQLSASLLKLSPLWLLALVLHCAAPTPGAASLRHSGASV